MKSKLAIAVILSGWLLFLIFVIYEQFEYKGQILTYFFKPSSEHEFILHVAIILIPIIFTVLGFFINEKKKLFLAAKESEEKYRDFYENAPDGIYSIGPDGTILEVNNTWLRMFGYERDEVIRKMKLTDLFTDDGLKVFQDTFSEFKKKGTVENIEYEFKRKDGTLFPVLINATAIYDKEGNFLRSRSIVRDISARVSYKKKLEHAAEEWRATFDSMPFSVMLIDRGFNIIRTNNYLSVLTNIPLKELIGKKCYEIIHGDEHPLKDCPLLKASKTHCTEAFEYQETRFNKYFMGYVTPIFDNEGTIKNYVQSLVDITDLKDKENKLTESRNAFFNMLKEVDLSYKELQGLYDGLIHSFVNAIDAKSSWTKGHSERVSNYAVAIAKEVGLKEEDIETLRTAALLHDIGKIGTYDIILDKPGKLSTEEFALIKNHPVKSEEILRPISQPQKILSLTRAYHERGEILNPVRHLQRTLPIIRSHHERIDGKGYPDGLKGDEIPFLARVITVADSFDSMTSDRPYRPAPGTEYAISELKKCSGIQFDPQVVETFLRILNKSASLNPSV